MRHSAVLTVAAAADLTLVTLPVTLRAHLTAGELPRLADTGPLGEHYDPAACAVACGWDDAVVQSGGCCRSSTGTCCGSNQARPAGQPATST